MRKTGYFFLAFVPLLLVEVIQIFALFFVFGVSFVTDFFYNINYGGIINSINDVYGMFSDYNFANFIMIIYSIIVICSFGLWYYIKLGGEFRFDFKNNFNFYKLSGIILLVPGAQFLSAYITNITGVIVPEWFEQYEELLDAAGFEYGVTVVLCLYSVIFAPICEEIIFRGVTMNLAKVAVPFWLANILQAFLFGVYHMNWIQGIYAFVLGLILGYICEHCGKIHYSILFHMLFNFWGTVLSGLMPDEISTIAAVFIFIFMFAALILGFILLHIGKQKTI